MFSLIICSQNGLATVAVLEQGPDIVLLEGARVRSGVASVSETVAYPFREKYTACHTTLAFEMQFLDTDGLLIRNFEGLEFGVWSRS